MDFKLLAKQMRYLQKEYFFFKAQGKKSKGEARTRYYNKAREILKQVKPLEKQFDELLEN